MTIVEIQKKYSLERDDFWEKEIKNKYKKVVKTIWIIKHDACEKIAVLENIELENIQVLNSEINFARFLITMKKENRKVTSVGEADKNNCSVYMPYFGCMAEKRGIDRCVLKLINAYEYGIYSEVEADSFSRVEKPEKTETQTEKEVNFFQYKNLNIEKLQEFLQKLKKDNHPQTAEVAEFLRKKILEEN